jgi:hypothetical protein
LIKLIWAAGAVLALSLTGCSDPEAADSSATESASAAPVTAAATREPVASASASASAAAAAPQPAKPSASQAAPAGVDRTLFGRIELLAPGKITVTPPGGAGQAAFLEDDTVLLVAYGKCPDGSGTESETVDSANRGTKKCTSAGLETFLQSNPLSGDVIIRGGIAVKIVEHKGG